MTDVENMTQAELRAYDEARADENETIAATYIQPPVHGGKDPDKLNSRRAAWGLLTQKYFQQMTGSEDENAISDLIADLLHTAHGMGQDPAEELRRAVFQFNAETSED